MVVTVTYHLSQLSVITDYIEIAVNVIIVRVRDFWQMSLQ